MHRILITFIVREGRSHLSDRQLGYVYQVKVKRVVMTKSIYCSNGFFEDSLAKYYLHSVGKWVIFLLAKCLDDVGRDCAGLFREGNADFVKFA